MERVLVIGGLGFIGYHLVHELNSQNYMVTISSRSERTSEDHQFPVVKLDLLQMSDEEICNIITPFDHIIFAGGSDDRKIPKGDPNQFFYEGNVIPCKKLATLSSGLQTKKLIMLGSYFSYFNRTNPIWKMTEKHPYVLSRSLQLSESLKAAEGKVAVSSVEIPYVFGAAPNHVPLWKPLVDYIDSWPVIFYTKGGTNIISVEELSKAIVGIINTPIYQESWTVGGVNLSWKEMIGMIANALDKKKKVITIPTFILKGLAILLNLYFKLSNKGPGLDPYHFLDIQTRKTYLDTSHSRSLLKYIETDIKKAVKETVQACKRPVNGTV